MKEVFDYILKFLLGENNSDLIPLIGYTADPKECSNYKIVVLKSSFFDENVYGTTNSLPKLPLSRIHGIPVLFGKPEIEKTKDSLILHSDIIAGTYFLISRYEEIVRRDIRDKHGRFIGKESLPFKAGFIDRPIVEEYGKLLRKLLREQGLELQEPESKIQKIYLTHDVDSIAHYRRLRGVAGSFLKNHSQIKEALKSYFRGIQYDPWFTFSWLLEQNNSLNGKNVESIFFIKPKGGKCREDQPRPNIRDKDYRFLFRLLKEDNATIAFHASYEAGIHPELILSEKEEMENVIGVRIKYNRHHFLDTREPEDMSMLIEAGITDDFTLGYADIAGFRLGTCRAVRWINPQKKQLTPLLLHPLTAMDGSLSEEKYMALSEADAYKYVVKLIDETEKYAGDLCLLWHNGVVEKGGPYYHRKLYAELIDYLREKN